MRLEYPNTMIVREREVTVMKASFGNGLASFPIPHHHSTVGHPPAGLFRVSIVAFFGALALAGHISLSYRCVNGLALTGIFAVPPYGYSFDMRHWLLLPVPQCTMHTTGTVPAFIHLSDPRECPPIIQKLRCLHILCTQKGQDHYHIH